MSELTAIRPREALVPRFSTTTRQSTLLFIGVCLVDLTSKWIAFQVGTIEPLITPGLNPELALGVLSTSAPLPLLILLILVAIALLVHSALLSSTTSTSWTIFPLIAAGAASNGVDRMATGAVHDWLNLGVAVANIADFALLAGLVLYVRTTWAKQ